MLEDNKLDELIEIGRPFLSQYLTDMGVKFKKSGTTTFFSCLNPDHEDKNPSCCFIPNTDDSIFYCHSCQSRGDIFQAASYLEGKPHFGLDFINENIYYILDKYNIQYSELEFSEEQLNRFRHEKVYQTVFDLMTSRNQISREIEYVDLTWAIEDRGWTEKTCLDFGIGSIKDYSTFLNQLSSITRAPITELQNMGILPDLFGPDYLTFCIRDHNKKIQGFVARRIDWTEGCEYPKYKNTSIEQNPFYRKEQILFGLDRAKVHKDQRLDIFEGYGSCVTAHQAGHKNSCALGGVALTTKHVDLIVDLGFSHVNLVLDVDATGSSKMEKYIEKFSGNSGLVITVAKLPISPEELKIKGQNDPDYFIKTHGIQEFRKIKLQGLFEHQLAKQAKFNEDDPMALKFAESMIPLLINEADMMKRGRMINTLAEYTKIDKDDIRAEVDRLQKSNFKSQKDFIERKIKNISSMEGLADLMQDVQLKLADTTTGTSERKLISLSETVDTFDNIFTEMNSASSGIHGWKTGFDPLDKLLDGIPKPGTAGGRLIGFGGAPSHAKSASLLNICLEVAQRNDDVSILYWAIDDNRRAIAYRLIAMISEVSMKKVTNMEPRSKEEDKKVKEAQEILRQLVVDQRLLFKDDKLGRQKSKAVNWIKHVQDSTGKEILFCIDSLHNIQGDDGQETRVKLLANSQWAKQLTVVTPCTVLATLELNKARDKMKPNLLHISESGKLEFDFDSIAIVYNQLQGNYGDYDSTSALWLDSNGFKHPIIELDFQKNKCGAGEKGSTFFKLDARTTKFVDCMTKYTPPGVQASGSIEM